MISLHITFTIFLHFKNHKIFFKTKTMVLIKTITLRKINKRHVNRKTSFKKRKSKTIVF